MLRKPFALLLAGLLCASAVLSGCSGKPAPDADSAAQSTGSSEPSAAASTDEDSSAAEEPSAAENEEPERLYAKIPEGTDFGGSDFTILCSSNGNSLNLVQNDFHAEEITGEPINDARFNRNSAAEDTLNVRIVDTEAPVGADNGFNYITRDVQANAGSYDMATCCGFSTAHMATGGFLYDLAKIPCLDFSAPWWDQVACETLQVFGQLFYTTGDITTGDNDATFCILFDKQLVGDYGLDDPYELVNTGKWTVDEFIKMSSLAAEDLNGDGIPDDDDRYGALLLDDCMQGIVNCVGAKCVTTDQDGYLQLTLYTETTADIITKFIDFACQQNIACAYQRKGWGETEIINMFSLHKALFLTHFIGIAPRTRDLDTDFGILPYFKYNEAQEKYYNTISSWYSVFYCIPNGPQDMERVGIVSEYLANSGMYELRSAYYEKTLKGKTLRDEESAVMLDLIFANRVYDVGWYHLFANYNGLVMDLLRNYSNTFASMYASNEKLAALSVSRTNDTFLALKDKFSEP